MNKKFSTLMAGFLLAGGLLSSAWAEQLSKVAGDGKYYTISAVAKQDADSKAWATLQIPRYLIGADGSLAQALGKSYWKVVKTEKGTYQLVNFEGEILKIGKSAAFSINEKGVEVGEEAYTQLSKVYMDSQKDILTNDNTKLVIAFDADATNLETPSEWEWFKAGLIDGKTYKFNVGDSYTSLFVAKEDPQNKGTFSFTYNFGGEDFYIADENEVTDNDFTVEETDNGYLLKTLSGKYVSYKDGKFSLVSDLKDASLFAFVESQNRVLTANQLNYYEENGFSVTIKGLNEPETAWNVTLKDNYFTGHLTPMAWDSNNKKFVAATTQSEFYVKNGNGKYVVALADLAEGSWQRAYAFTEVSEDVLKRDILKSGEQKYYGKFQFNYNEKESVTAVTEIVGINVFDHNNKYKGQIGRLDFRNEAYLAVEPTYNYEQSPIVLKPIQIKLGGDNLADWKKVLAPKFFTVKNLKDGKVLGIVENEACVKSEFVSSVNNILESQWALTYDEVANTYIFTNRENQNATYTIAGTALYESGTKDDHIYSLGGKKFEIKPVETTEADGYDRLGSTVDLLNKKFHIAFYSKVFGGNAWFTEEHSEGHAISLSADDSDASIWTAVAHNAEKKEYENAAYQDKAKRSDSIYVVNKLYFWNAEDEIQDYIEDTLKVVTYSFVNQYNEKLFYNTASKTFFAKKVGEAVKENEKEYFYALRQKAEKLNLRLVEPWKLDEEVDGTTTPLYQTSFDDCANQQKVYAGDTQDGLLNVTNLFNRIENDLFVIEETNKPMYRRVVNPLDTISIFRNDNEKSVLFEDKHFLGMENIAQFPQIASGMVADTAYVRYNTYRPQYMLVVGPKVTPAGKYCPVHGVGADCKDEHLKDVDGWVEGRYLVNLVDTAIKWDKANKHKVGNPYINSENYYRLGFVQATHIKDTLIIASDNKKIIVGNDGYNQAKFAFRYDDQAAGSFRIETANYKRLPGIDKVEKDGEGWLKWMNGVVVVVDKIEDADIFNMDEKFEEQPTDNETIATSEVTVIAGEGQVTIAGAAGKKVVISNILGQVVANTVLASDNAVIAAPQGVVVVAVEGEEAVKAIVK